MNQTKQTFLIISILAILALSVGGLFVLGGKTINQESQTGYTIIAFENLSSEFDSERENFEAFDFFIQNKEEQKNEYALNFHLENQLLGESEQKLGAGQEQKIRPAEESEIKEKIKKFLADNPGKTTLRFKVEISWGKKKQTISREIILSEKFIQPL